MKYSRGISLAVIIVAVVGLIIASAMYFIFNNLQSKVSIIIGDGVYESSVAMDEKTREKGLSGVTSLKENEALLMVFPSDNEWRIWMKDMKVPIDIAWLNKDKKVVYIVKNASPENGQDASFTPKAKAKYVLELPAGSVDNAGIRMGESAVFTLDEGGVE